MSLFNMLKRSVNKAVQNAVDAAVEAKLAPVIESAVEKAEKYIKPMMEERADTVVRTAKEAAGQVNLYNYPGSAEDYFLGLLTESCPGCSVEKNVSAQRLFPGAYTDAMPRNILISRMGKPCLLILLLPKNGYRLKRIDMLKTYCERAGIRHMQFFLEFRNEAGYVVNRVRQAL